MRPFFMFLGGAGWCWLAYRGFTGFEFPAWWVGLVHLMMAVSTLLEITWRRA